MLLTLRHTYRVCAEDTRCCVTSFAVFWFPYSTTAMAAQSDLQGQQRLLRLCRERMLEIFGLPYLNEMGKHWSVTFRPVWHDCVLPVFRCQWCPFQWNVQICLAQHRTLPVDGVQLMAHIWGHNHSWPHGLRLLYESMMEPHTSGTSALSGQDGLSPDTVSSTFGTVDVAEDASPPSLHVCTMDAIHAELTGMSSADT